MTHAVLVTGGAGYIGGHACKALQQAGFLPVTLDNLCLGHEHFVKWGPLVRGSTHDRALVAQTIRDHKIVAVMHFAAFACVGESVADPAIYYDNNVAGTLGLLQGMRDADCKTLVFSSTCAVYGAPEVLPIVETTPAHPVNPYGRSKLICEQMMKDFSQAYGLDYTVLRYFNASGDDADGEIGEDRATETHLIPRAMMAIQGYVDDFQVFGADFPTHDGTAIRDYIHVTDLAEAHVLTLRRLLEGARGGAVFNLGLGRGYSVREIISVITDVTGHVLDVPRGARRPGDPAELVANADLARRELGFTPSHSDLRNIIATAWSWHQATHPRRNDQASAPLRPSALR